MPRRCRTARHEDRAIAVEIDGVSIMIGRWFVDRGAAGEMISRLIVMGVAMASWNAIVSVIMAVCMALAVIMTRHMDMRPIGMPRSLGKRLMRMRQRSPAEKQMRVHDQNAE